MCPYPHAREGSQGKTPCSGRLLREFGGADLEVRYRAYHVRKVYDNIMISTFVRKLQSCMLYLVRVGII
jgi:hypothetical protein